MNGKQNNIIWYLYMTRGTEQTWVWLQKSDWNVQTVTIIQAGKEQALGANYVKC